MAAFDYVIILLSFVYALALTHLLSRVGALMLDRQRVRFSGLQALVMLTAGTQVYLNWLAIWYARGFAVWNLLSITGALVFAIWNYLLCVAAGPTLPEEGLIDLNGFYWQNRRLFWSVFTAGIALAVVINLGFTKTAPLTPRQSLQWTLATLAFFLPGLLALAVSARWAQWTAALGAMAVSIAWLILFSASLH